MRLLLIPLLNLLIDIINHLVGQFILRDDEHSLKYAPAALPTDIIAKAVMKNKAMMRRGRLRMNSIHKSLTFTLADSDWSITTRSFVWLKQKMSSANPMSE